MTHAAVLQDVVRMLNEKGVVARLSYPNLDVIDPNDARRTYHFGTAPSVWCYDIRNEGAAVSRTSLDADCSDAAKIADVILKVIKEKL